MKLVINYDLVNEIFKANTGINLKQFETKMGIYMGTMASVGLTSALINPEVHPINLATALLHGTIVFGAQELALKTYTKRSADMALNNLASSLTKINIYTDAEKIKQAKLYKTQYKLVRGDEKKTYLQQNKYIMLPTTGSFNADEVSLLQEHNVGSREYVLSIGEPKNKLSKSLSRNFAHQI